MQARDRRELDREAEAHSALGVLLRKKRSPEKREEVRRLLASNLSTAGIVDAIREVDARPDEPESGEAEQPETTLEEPREGATNSEDEVASAWARGAGARGEAAGSDLRSTSDGAPTLGEAAEAYAEVKAEEARESPPKPPQPFRFSVSKLRSILKLPQLKAPFLRYLFRELKRMLDFGKISHVFSPLFLLPIVRLDLSVSPLLADWLPSWCTELASYLKPILQVGWKHVSKREYNMIVALERLCSEVESINFKLLNLRDRSLLDKLRTLETLFFAFHYSPDTVPELLDAAGEIMRKEPALTDRAERAELLISRILLKDFTVPSFFNVVVGLNMLRFHRCFTMSDLIAKDLGELFEEGLFACDYEIQAEIDKYLDEAKRRLLRLRTEYGQARRVVGMLRLDQGEVTDFSLLRDLYEQPGVGYDRRSFDEDKDNIMTAAPILFRRFDAAFATLLCGKITIERVGRYEIFTESFFLSELDRMRLATSKIERLAFGFRSLPYDRYLAIKQGGTAAISTESEVMSHLRDALLAVVAVGKRIDRVLAMSRFSQQASGPARSARLPRPLDPSVLQLTHPYELPFANDPIGGGGYLHGKTVSDALSIAAGACFHLAMYLQDRSVIDTVSSEARLRDRIEAQLEIVKRIGDSAVYSELAAGFRFSG